MNNVDILKGLIVDSLCDVGKRLGKVIFKGFLIYVAIILCLHWFTGGFDRDSTDGEDRSGMKIHIDNLTGCHYLSTSGGAMHSRISASGEHYGCRSIKWE